MSGLASDGWACERASLPVALRVGATGFGAGVGCGVGVGFGTPLNLAGVPVLGSAASGISAGVGQARGLLGGAERRLLALLPRGAAAGAGCGVGIGYGFGAGLFLKPSAGEALARRFAALRDAVAARLPAQAQQQIAQHAQLAPHLQPQQQSPPAAASDAALSAATQRAADAEHRAERLSERVTQLSDSLAALRAEQAALRSALCGDHAAQPPWASAFCERRNAS